MPKTKNAFAFRVFYEAGKNGSFEQVDEAVTIFFHKGFSIPPSYLSPNYGKYGNYIGMRRRLAFCRHLVDRGNFFKKLIKKHQKRLKKLLGIVARRAIKNGVANSKDIEEKIFRIEELLEKYKFVYEGVVMLNTSDKKILAIAKKDIKKAAAESFGIKLRLARRDKGYLAKDFAKLLNISQNGYSQYETGTNEPPLYLISEMADRLDVSTDWLLGRTD